MAAAAQPHYLQTMTAHDLDLDQVVWAKVKGFSFWPGQIFEEDDKEPGRLAVPHRWRSCGGDAPRDHRLHAPQEVVSRFVR